MNLDSILAIYATSEPHRRKCEAKMVRAMPLKERVAYIEDVRRIRGDASADQLWLDVTEGA